jgi:hypothetical protein
MTFATPEPATNSAQTVLCPRCGLPCSLMPLRRPGAFRLVDPDGHGHAAVCIASVEPAPMPVRYRPMPVTQRPSVPVPPPSYRPLAALARRA